MAKMVYDYSKLLGRIKEKGLNQEKFASMIDVAPATLSLKLSNQAKFKQDEIDKACSILDIDHKDIGVYFFAYKV